MVQHFTFGVTVAFTLNYIIGTGFLTLPWAFQQTGCLIGIAILGTMTLFAMISACLIVENMARAALLSSNLVRNDDVEDVVVNNDSSLYQSVTSFPFHDDGGIELKSPIRLPEVDDDDDDDNIDDIIIPSQRIKSNNHDYVHDIDKVIVGEHKFEVGDLCEIFLGKQGRYAYTATICVYLYGTLWAYATVFAKAMTTHLNIGKYSYGLYLLLYAFLVVPPSLLELSEQIIVQVILSFCRILMLLLMVVTIFNAYAYSDVNAFDGFDHQAMMEEEDVYAINVHKLYILLPIAAFANIFHHSIPGLSEPVLNKKSLSKAFCLALLISCVGYAAIGVVISTYFGSYTMVASNLNWSEYIGTSSSHSFRVLASIVSFYIVLFPAFDVASVFPLCAITLGNSMYSAYNSAKVSTSLVNCKHSDEDFTLLTQTSGDSAVDESRESKMKRKYFRLLASVPPIICAYFMSNLGQITDFTGITGFFIAFIFPAMLSRASISKLTKLNLPTRTYYTTHFTSNYMINLTLLFGIGLTLYVLISFIAFGPPIE